MPVFTGMKAKHVGSSKAIFQSLCSSGFTSDPVLGKSILITGKGYPDVATRELVKALSEKLPARYVSLDVVFVSPVRCDSRLTLPATREKCPSSVLR